MKPKTDNVTGFIQALESFLTSPGTTLTELQQRGYLYAAVQFHAAALLEKGT